MIVNVTKGTAKCDSIFNSVGISAAANGKTLTFAAAEAFVAVEKGVDKRCIVGNCMGRNEVFIVRKARSRNGIPCGLQLLPAGADRHSAVKACR